MRLQLERYTADGVAGAPFLRDGPPRDHSTIVEVTIGYQLGG